ncbi:hypothetical protein EVAR_58547_1 [Eumeta japonica]|uniref:Adenylate cyclase N-terminal domain-containing protein n=1 Tax=Eumeta variegata TaxID=151549 RepID=A0A4C1Z6F6_EUMVA|nr:hypothetical protein EVAR_58547_1 [Eumeta japonica]
MNVQERKDHPEFESGMDIGIENKTSVVTDSSNELEIDIMIGIRFEINSEIGSGTRMTKHYGRSRVRADGSRICITRRRRHRVLDYSLASSHLTWTSVVGNVAVFICVNVVGALMHSLMETAQRRAFLDTRNCIAARLDMEDENEKLERLLLSVLPQHVAMEMKNDIISPVEGQFHKIYIQKHEQVRSVAIDLKSGVCQYPNTHKWVKTSKFILERGSLLRVWSVGFTREKVSDRHSRERRKRERVNIGPLWSAGGAGGAGKWPITAQLPYINKLAHAWLGDLICADIGPIG